MLFGLAQSLRSLTASPMAGLVQEAHRMARRRLEAGGSAAPRGQVDDQRDMDDFELPGDLDANELKIIEAKLRDGAGNLKDAPPLIDSGDPVDAWSYPVFMSCGLAAATTAGACV